MIINLLIGGILIITGVFTKLFPDIMIAGYNQMTKEQKAKVNIKGLSWFMSICLITIGLAVVGTRFLFKNIGYSKMECLFISMLPIVVGVVVILVGGQRYGRNGK